MFRDRQEELQRIQQQLLDEDIPETDEALLEDIADLVDDVQEGYEPDGFYNNDYTDLDPEQLSQELLYEEPRENLKGLVVAAVLLTLGIVLSMAFVYFFAKIRITNRAYRVFTAILIAYLVSGLLIGLCYFIPPFRAMYLLFATNPVIMILFNSLKSFCY